MGGFEEKTGGIVGLLSMGITSNGLNQFVALRFNKQRVAVITPMITGQGSMALWRYDYDKKHADVHVGGSYFGDFHFDAHAQYVEDGMDILFKDLILLDAILLFGCIGCLCLSIGMVFGYLIHYIEKTRKYRI